MAKLTLPLALAALLVLAGCAAIDSPAGTTPAVTDTPALTSPPSTPQPTDTPSAVGPDEPPLDLVPGPSNLADDELPHSVRIETERDATVNVTLDIAHDGEGSSRQFRLFPDTTVVGTLDTRADYTLTVTAGNRSATETLPASTFDCNSSGTTFTVTDDGVSVNTVSTEIACQ